MVIRMKKIRPYYPGGMNPLHNVTDWCRVRSLIRALRRGESLPPVYCDGDLGSGNWLSGTHRVAASEIRCLLGDTSYPYEDLSIIDITDLDLTTSQWEAFWSWHADDHEAPLAFLDEEGEEGLCRALNLRLGIEEDEEV